MSVDVQTPPGPGAGGPSQPRGVRVVAVLVAHDGVEWLPRTLGALAGSMRRPDLVVAVDAGSRDRSGEVLRAAAGTTPVHVVDEIVDGSARDGFGTSVRRGLAAADRLLADLDAGGPAAGRVPVEEWVWLLHDDSAPEPDALDELLSVATASPTLAVAGCKLLGWDEPRLLLEVGATVSPGGRRLSDVADGDIDQGQHDDRGDVLLVSTAGMLVRRSVLEHVGGFDPSIPLVGDDVDLCLRVRRAGHRVAVVPAATVRHVSALERGARPADALHGVLARRAGVPPPRAGSRTGGLESARRRHWLHVRLVQAALPVVPLLWLWVVLVTPVRALAWLVRGRPGRALAEVDATLRLLARSWRVVASRWRARRSRAVPASTLRLLQRSRSQVLREDLDAWRARRSLRREDEDEDGDEDGTVPLEAVESGPVDDDLIHLDLGASGPARRFFTHPMTYLVPLVAVVGALPALRHLLRPAALDADGVALVQEDPTAGLDAVTLLARASVGWRDTGLGAVGVADPATTVWAGLTAVVSTLTRGAPAAATLGDARTAVTLLAPLLALVLAYPAMRRLVRSRAAAGAAALTWALLPATGLLGRVDAAALLVHALLPLLPLCMLGCLGRRPVNAVAATGLLGAVVVALSPATWPVLVLLAVLVAVLGGSRTHATWRACLPLLGAAAPALVWAPWFAAVVGEPRALLVAPAAVDPTLTEVPTAAGLLDLAAAAPPLLQQALGQPSVLLARPVPLLVGGALVLLLAGGLLGVALVVAALTRRRVPAAWCGVAVALGAAATGAGAALVSRTTGLPGAVPASAVLLALALVAGLLVRDLNDPDRPRPREDRAPRRALGALATAVQGLLPVGVVAVVLAVGLLVPQAEAPPGLPAPALVGAQSPQATRTLLLGSDGDGVVAWTVTAGQPGPGQASVAGQLGRPLEPLRAGERRLGDAVASALGDGSVPGGDVAAALARLGVGWLVVADSPAVDTALAQRAGMVRTGVAQGRTTWRVDPAAAGSGPVPARVRLEGPDGSDLGAVDLAGGGAEVAAGVPGRVLVLADNARSGWQARLDGATLTPTTVGGWAQGFLLPAAGGELEVRPPVVGAGLRTAALAALVVLGLALLWPGPSHRVRDHLSAPAGRGLRRRRTRLLVHGGRAVGASVTGLVVLLLLAVGTGVGLTPGRLQVDRALAPTEGAGPAGGPLAGVLPDLPEAADPAAAAPLVTLAAAGSVQTCPGPEGAEATALGPVDGRAGTGAALRGLDLGVTRDGDDRGVRLAACPSTAASSWVLLGGTGVGERPRLLLANPGETGAVADVRVGGPDGVVVTPAATGILIPPGGRTEVALDALAPDLPSVLAEVAARVGTVAVSGDEAGLLGLVPQGGDRVSAEVAPSTGLVLPLVQVPGAPGEARLLVASVGDDPAVVQLSLTRTDGEPLADEAVPSPVVAPAGGLVEVPLSDLPPGGYAVRLSADVPVVAGATWSRQRGGPPEAGLTGVPADRAWVQAVPADAAWSTPLRLPLAALVGDPAVRQGTVLTLLSGSEAGSRARLAVEQDDGTVLASRSVETPAGGRPVDLPLPELLEGVDPAQAGSLVVTSAVGVHVALRVDLADEDGPLVGATTVPGGEAPRTQVRLLRR